MSHLNIDFLERSSSEGPDVPRWLTADLPAKEQIALPPRGQLSDHSPIVLGANLISSLLIFFIFVLEQNILDPILHF